MSRALIQRQKVRTWQLVLLAVGGVLIFWGFLLFEGKQDLSEGYRNLTKGLHADAIESFTNDLDANPDRLESRFGLGLALLYENRGLEAEEHYKIIHEVQTEDRTPAPTHKIWSENHPREWLKFKGYFYLFNARMAAERMMRAYRVGEEQEHINDLYSDYEREKNTFKDFVDQVESNRREPGQWAKYYAELVKLVTSADRRTDLSRGLSELGNKRDLKLSTSAEINRALPFIENTLKEAPTRIEPRAWHLLLVTQLARRGEVLYDSRAATSTLAKSLSAAEQRERQRFASFEDDGYDGLDDGQRIRFLLAIGDAAHYMSLKNASEADNLRGLKDAAVARASQALSASPNIAQEEEEDLLRMLAEIPK